MIFLKTWILVSSLLGKPGVQQTEIVIPGTMEDCVAYLHDFAESVPKSNEWVVTWPLPNSVRIELKEGANVYMAKTCTEVKRR